MPAPAFRWNDYEVPADGGSQALGDATLASTDAPAAETMTISLPDLGAFPTPREKAAVLLQTAAEIEHALMVQYLYAAYSLKDLKEVTDPAQKAALRPSSGSSWPTLLLDTAREEMGHLMTVQNLLLLLGMAPNLEREDFPPQKDLYPFKLRLEPLTQLSVAKYVLAEAPDDATGIQDIRELATEAGVTTINRVGVLYGLLGFIFATPDQIAPGATGDEIWDAMIRRIAGAAIQQAPAGAWHLPDADFDAGSMSRQADPAAWQVGHVRVHRLAGRADAVQAIRDVGEQGEGPTGAGELSHFGRFMSIFGGQPGPPVVPAVPPPGDWLPTRAVPADPVIAGIIDERARRWAQLADIRYALLLGFVEHCLLAPDAHRDLLTAWIFPEMRSRLGFIARLLTKLPLGDGQPHAAGVAFTMPAVIHLPADEPARWALHRERTTAAIAHVEVMVAAGDDADPDPTVEPKLVSGYLADLRASDKARVALIDQLPAAAPIPTSFARDILPLFRPKDVNHMDDFGVVLNVYEKVDEFRDAILDRLTRTDADQVMPEPPDPRWTAPQVALFERWISEGRPR